MIEHRLIPQADGALIDWGRHATINGVRGVGSPKYYSGEDAEVLRLVIKHMKNDHPAERPKDVPRGGGS